MIERGANVMSGDIGRVVADIVKDHGFIEHDGYQHPFSEFGIRYREYVFGKYKREGDEILAKDNVPLADQLLRFSDVMSEAVKAGHRVVVWRARPAAVGVTLPGKTHVQALHSRLHFMTLEDYKSATTNEHTLKAYRHRKLQETNDYNDPVVFALDNYKNYDDPKKLPDAPEPITDFGWALKKLRAGHNVTRSEWHPEFSLSFANDNIFLNSSNFSDLWNPSMADVLAFDWCLAKDPHVKGS